MSREYSQPFAIVSSDGHTLVAGVFGDIQGGEAAAKANALLIAAAHETAAKFEALKASHAELLATAKDFLPEFSEWEGPEEPETSYAAKARNRNVRIYERFRAALANAEKL